MRESCSCGAHVVTFRRSVALDWRANHLHPDRPEPAEPEKQGAHATTEIAWQPPPDGQPIIMAKAGFGREPR